MIINGGEIVILHLFQVSHFSPLLTIACLFELIGEKLRKLEEEKGIVVRFMIGHRYRLMFI